MPGLSFLHKRIIENMRFEFTFDFARLQIDYVKMKFCPAVVWGEESVYVTALAAPAASMKTHRAVTSVAVRILSENTDFNDFL